MGEEAVMVMISGPSAFGTLAGDLAAVIVATTTPGEEAQTVQLDADRPYSERKFDCAAEAAGRLMAEDAVKANQAHLQQIAQERDTAREELNAIQAHSLIMVETNASLRKELATAQVSLQKTAKEAKNFSNELEKAKAERSHFGLELWKVREARDEIQSKLEELKKELHESRLQMRSMSSEKRACLAHAGSRALDLTDDAANQAALVSPRKEVAKSLDKSPEESIQLPCSAVLEDVVEVDDDLEKFASADENGSDDADCNAKAG